MDVFFTAVIDIAEPGMPTQEPKWVVRNVTYVPRVGDRINVNMFGFTVEYTLFDPLLRSASVHLKADYPTNLGTWRGMAEEMGWPDPLPEPKKPIVLPLPDDGVKFPVLGKEKKYPHT